MKKNSLKLFVNLIAVAIITFLFLREENTSMLYVLLSLDSILVLRLMVCIACKVVQMYCSYKIYEFYKELFWQIKYLHKVRYKLYFIGTRKEVELCSTEINEKVDKMFEVYEEIASNKVLTKKHQKQVQKILTEAYKLTKTIR